MLTFFPIACKKHRLILALLLILFNISVYGQKTVSLPRGVPETEGVTSAGIDSFLYAQTGTPHEFHSFMFLRHGKVIAEGWWNPYKSTLRHSLYSTSKSFTSTAIGFAVTEKRITVNDKVISFFPKSLPDSISPNLAQLTIRDLLTMSAGQTPDPTMVIPFSPGSWAKSFLATPIVNTPGTKFLYNTMATYMLSAIIQKVTGQKVVDYLTPRLFTPLGIKGMDWEQNDEGINTGGWGLRLKTEDMAKLGQLYLQKGYWNGKQLLPKAWVEEATTFKIDQAPGVAQSKKDSSDWMQGYCYQFWRCRNNAFRADGAFGQYIIVMPDQDAVVAITCETPDMQGEINLVWKYLLPAIQPKTLPANALAQTNLKLHLAALSLPPLEDAGNSMRFIKNGASKTFALQNNDLGIKTIAFSMVNDTCRVLMVKDSSVFIFNFLSGKWLIGKTNLSGPSLLAKAKEKLSLLQPYRVAGSYGWQYGKTLVLKLRYIESPHAETMTFNFFGDKLIGQVENSFDFGKKKIELDGELSY